MITTADNEDYIIKDESDDRFIIIKQCQIIVRTRLQDKLNILGVDMIATVLSSWLTNLSPNKTFTKFVASFPKDLINLEFITPYQNSIDKYRSGKGSRLCP